MSNLILQSINRSLPNPFIRSLARDVEWAYREAHEASFNNPLLDRCDAEYTYPHYRRSIMEKRVRDSASKAGLSATVKWNHANNYQYTEIDSRDWIFTLKHTSDEKHMLRSSIFREQSAALNGLLPQLVMPTILGIDEAPERKFSAIIFHATDRDDDKVPGFIRIGVPREDFSWWEQCFDIHELLIGDTTSSKTEDEIKVIAKWKKRADRNRSNEA